MDSDSGRAALRMIDKLLAERPEKVGHDFSEATRCLTAFRDSLISRFRETGAADDQKTLAKVNAVLAVIVGGHFPLGNIPWNLIEKSRDELAGVVGGVRARSLQAESPMKRESRSQRRPQSMNGSS